MHLALEMSNLELVEKGRLTSGDLVIGRNNLNWVNDFDLTFDDLGLDVKGLEERGLLGVHTSGTSRVSHNSWSDSTDSGWGFSNL